MCALPKPGWLCILRHSVVPLPTFWQFEAVTVSHASFSSGMAALASIQVLAHKLSWPLPHAPCTAIHSNGEMRLTHIPTDLTYLYAFDILR